MKIAILAQSLGRSRGGIEAWVYHAADELLRSGHSVTLFHMQIDTPMDAAPEGANVISLNKSSGGRLLKELGTGIQIRRQLKPHTKRYDVFWARSYLMAWVLASLLPKHTFVYIHAAPYPLYARIRKNECKLNNTDSFGLRRQLAWSISIFWISMMERYAIRSASNVFLSISRKDETLNYYNIASDDVHVIPPGVDLDYFRPGKDQWQGQGTLKIITVCRLVPDKNVQCLLYAMHELVKRNVDASLTVVGEGRQEDELKRLSTNLSLADRVLFEGRQSNIADWYQKHHVFVLVSLFEGFGSVYIEAMACGLPCIALSPNATGHRVATEEIIDHEANGYLLKDNNPSELADYLQTIYNDPGKLNAMTQVARQKVENQFCWRNTVNSILNLRDRAPR